MKILIVGAADDFAIENFYAKNMSALGWEVTRFDAPGMFYNYYRGGLLNKLLFKSGISQIYRKINQKLIQSIITIKPDVIWIFKGMEIFPETLKWIKSRQIILVNFNADNPFIFSGTGSGNSNISNSIRLYDLHFTYNQDIRQQLEAISPGNVWYLPFGFELPESVLDECKKQKEIIKTCFLGNPDAKRAAFIQALTSRGIQIDLYGNNWDSFVKNDSVTIHPEVRGLDFWKTLRRYRIQLNLMRIHSEDSHNMRTFEVPGVGGIMLAKNTTEHLGLFTDKKEAWFYADEESCASFARALLNMSESEADDIRKAARKRSLEDGYQYKDRALFVSTVIKQYLEKKA